MSTGPKFPSKILIADADANQRLALARAFNAHGAQVRATPQADTLIKWSDELDAGLVIVDLGGPSDPAHAVLRELRRRRPGTPILATLRETGLNATVQAMESGAFDVLPKPYGVEQLLAVARRVATARADREAAQALARAVRDERAPLIGRSAAMQDLYRAVGRLVSTDISILIQGETGTGKALVARALHDLGPRRDQPFVAVSLVSADPESLAGELLGAGDGRPGRLAQAEGGTLYLDSVCDLSEAAQAQLVRVLDTLPASDDARSRGRRPRIVAAAHRDLDARVRAGRFRDDLYYRLSVAPLHVPPLRARPEDIGDLARAFLLRSDRAGGAPRRLDDPALQRLRAHEWPGNVRELENLIRRICALYPDPVIDLAIVERELNRAVAAEPAGESVGGSLSRAVERAVSSYFDEATRPAAGLHEHILRAVEQPMLQAALLATRGNRIRAAEILGINRNTLRRKMDELGIEVRPVLSTSEPASGAETGAPASLAA